MKNKIDLVTALLNLFTAIIVLYKALAEQLYRGAKLPKLSSLFQHIRSTMTRLTNVIRILAFIIAVAALIVAITK